MDAHGDSDCDSDCESVLMTLPSVPGNYALDASGAVLKHTLVQARCLDKDAKGNKYIRVDADPRTVKALGYKAVQYFFIDVRIKDGHAFISSGDWHSAQGRIPADKAVITSSDQGFSVHDGDFGFSVPWSVVL